MNAATRVVLSDIRNAAETLAWWVALLALSIVFVLTFLSAILMLLAAVSGMPALDAWMGIPAPMRYSSCAAAFTLGAGMVVAYIASVKDRARRMNNGK